MNSKIKLNASEVKDILEDYYRKYEDQPDVKIEIRVEKGAIGYRNEEGAVLVIKVLTEAQILGAKRKLEEQIDADKVRDIFIQVLSAANYDVDRVQLDYGLDSQWEGYGPAEHKIDKPYFKGANIFFKAPNKVLKN